MFLKLFKSKKRESSASDVAAPDSWNPNSPLPDSFKEIALSVYSKLDLPTPSSENTLSYLFSRQNSYFKSGDTVVLVEPGVARLAGFYSRSLKVNGKKAAFFGFWETLDVFEPNRRLFEQVENWAKKQGAEELYGPVQFSTFGRYRLQLSHFGEGETFEQEPSNPEYYVTLMSRLGFKLDQVYSTYRSTKVEAIRDAVEKMAGKAFHLESQQFRAHPITEEYVKERAADLLDAVNDVFSDNFAFTPIDDSSFKAAFSARFIERICPKTSFVIEHASKKIAALCICYHDTSHPGTLYVKTVGIVKEFRGRGISLIHLIREILSRAPASGQVVLCLMKKGNFPSLLMQDFAQDEKTYGLFKKRLE